jgi:hypothetical protein
MASILAQAVIAAPVEPKCMGEDQVAALPRRLKLLFEVEQRLALTEIAETVRQEINAAVQEGYIFMISIAKWSEAQADYLGSATPQVFDRAGQ